MDYDFENYIYTQGSDKSVACLFMRSKAMLLTDIVGKMIGNAKTKEDSLKMIELMNVSRAISAGVEMIEESEKAIRIARLENAYLMEENEKLKRKVNAYEKQFDKLNEYLKNE